MTDHDTHSPLFTTTQAVLEQLQTTLARIADELMEIRRNSDISDDGMLPEITYEQAHLWIDRIANALPEFVESSQLVGICALEAILAYEKQARLDEQRKA